MTHGDPAAPVVLALAVLLLAAKLGGHVAMRFGQPAVLGELLGGVLLGNTSLLGFHGFDAIKTDGHIDMVARLGVIVLLFEVGLESTVAQMLKVGWSSLWVACLGVVTPFLLGWGMASWLLTDQSTFVHLFVGATLTATSVGITARVLRDLKESQSPEARIILGAAVIDDVLGLVILAVVTGLISAAGSGGHFELSAMVATLVKAFVFLVGALVVGRWLAPRLLRVAGRIRSSAAWLSLALAFCFVLSWLADVIGLAPIVGAFAAGLVLEEDDAHAGSNESLEHLIRPISSFLVPVFFVLMGLRTDLGALAQPSVLVFTLALCVVAVIGKLVAGLGVVGAGLRRSVIGVGMLPRGEVGLIFAATSVAGVRVLGPAIFASMVAMVMITTLITPPLLKWRLSKPISARNAGT